MGVLLGAGFGLLMRSVTGYQESTPGVQALIFAAGYVALGGVLMLFTARPQWFVTSTIAAFSVGYLLCCILFVTPLRHRLLASNKK